MLFQVIILSIIPGFCFIYFSKIICCPKFYIYFIFQVFLCFLHVHLVHLLRIQKTAHQVKGGLKEVEVRLIKWSSDETKLDLIIGRETWGIKAINLGFRRGRGSSWGWMGYIFFRGRRAYQDWFMRKEEGFKENGKLAFPPFWQNVRMRRSSSDFDSNKGL